MSYCLCSLVDQLNQIARTTLATTDTLQSMPDYFEHIPTPIGPITVTGDGDGVVTSISFDGHLRFDVEPLEPAGELFAHLKSELNEYFQGSRKEFTVAHRAQGTEFQLEVWDTLCKIPFGETVSYLDVARYMGNVGAIRAIGAANGKNPIPILVPCHRVIGAKGDLVGFSGGIERKVFLLKHEIAHSNLMKPQWRLARRVQPNEPA